MKAETSVNKTGIHAGKIGCGLVRAIVLLSMMTLMGCAASYDCYPCGKVNCNYCPPHPLPYSQYDSCNCSDSPGGAYLAELSSRQVMDLAPVEASDPGD